MTVNFIVHLTFNFSYYYYQITFIIPNSLLFTLKESLKYILIHYYIDFGFLIDNKND
jgi:hypothetical protein